MLNPTHLITLREVLASGSFAGAASRLGYTPSAVSQQVAALERATSLRLFERHARSARPTEAAFMLGRRAEGVLGSLDALEREVRALAASDRGVIRLGSFPTASAGVLPHALARLREIRPDVVVQLDEGEPNEIVPRLVAGGLDLALAYQYETVPRTWPSEVRAVTLLTERLFLFVPVSFDLSGSSDRLAVSRLRDATWIATREGTAGERCLLQLCADAGFTPRIDYRTNDFDVIRGLVSSGVGVALIPELAAVDGPSVRRLLPRHRAPTRDVLALSREATGNPLVEPALAALVESIQTLSPGTA